MLAQAGDETKIDQMIASGNWHFERKYDGERGVMQVVRGGGLLIVYLRNRQGKTINTQFPELVEMGKHLPSGIYDGEIYVPSNSANKDKPTTAGRTSVGEADAKLRARINPATFMCFDVLEFEGENIEKKNYEERKARLSEVSSLGIVGFKGVMPETNPRAAWDEIRGSGDEGMVAKRRGSPYSHTRSPHWCKLKTWNEEDFDVVGITSEKREVSALVLDNGMKVNCALNGEAYAALIADLVRSGEIMKCADGTTATKLTKHYRAKVKFLNKSASGLRFPILHQLEGF